MRVLHFCESFSPISETFIYDLIVELERQGVDNHVVSFERENADTRPFSKVAIVSRAERYHPWRIALRGWHGRRPGAALEAAWQIERPRLKRVLEHTRPDLVHAHFGPAGVLIAPVAQQLSIKCITSFHGYDVTRVPREGFWKKQYDTLWTQTAAVTGVSGHICGLLEALGANKEKIVRISNGVKLSKFPFTPPARRFDGKNVRCLFVGRLVEKKAPLLLLRAFERAHKVATGRMALTLDIVGEGPLMPQLMEERRMRGLEGCVRMHGARGYREVSEMLQTAHIFLQHSVTATDGDQEGQGVSMMEAAATGLPVISTQHDGIPEVVLDGKTGFLVAEHDVEGMGERLANLVDNPGMWDELGARGREHIEKNMQLETQAETWRNLYKRVNQGDNCSL